MIMHIYLRSNPKKIETVLINFITFRVEKMDTFFQFNVSLPGSSRSVTG